MNRLEEQTQSWIRRHYLILDELRNEMVSKGTFSGDARFQERLKFAIRQLRYASALHRDKPLFVAANAWMSRLASAGTEGQWTDGDWIRWMEQVMNFLESREEESAPQSPPPAESALLPKVLVIGSGRLFAVLNDADHSGGEPGYVIDQADWGEWETIVHQEMVLDRQAAVILHARSSDAELPGAIRRIREVDSFVHLPIAVVAEGLEPAQLTRLYDSPADLVLPGPLEGSVLHAAIRKLLSGTGRGRMGSLTDERAQLVQLVAKEWQRYIRFQSPFSLVYVSLEQYPYLLQRYGAKQVNEALSRMFVLSRQSIRTSDEIRRWKVNAFVLLLPMANKEGGHLVARRIQRNIAAELGHSPLYAFMRIGVTEGERGYEHAEEIVKRMERLVTTEALSETLYVAPAISAQPERSSRIKVLIVDDDLVTPVMMQHHLNRAEWEVEICTDSSRALEQTMSFRPHIILSETQLEGNNGYSYCIQCRQLYSRVEAVFIFLSHQTTTSNIVRGFNVGADDFIAKPFAAAEVEARMRMHWELRNMLREPGVDAERGKVVEP